MQIQSFRRITAALSAALLIVLTAMPLQTAHAAGSALVTVSASPSSVETNGDVTLSFYVAPTGANVYSVQVNVSLVNLTYRSYAPNPNASAWGGSNSVAAGGSTGSTSFQIVASQQGASAGHGSQTLIGTVVVRASGTTGTGQISLSGAEAYDTNGDTMSASAQSANVTINAPQAPVEQEQNTGNNGGGSGPTETDDGSSTGQADQGGVNPINRPNADSQAVIPGENGEGKVISENDYSRLASETLPADTVATTVSKKASNLPVVLAVALFGAAGLFLIIFRVVLPRMNRGFVSGSAQSGGTGSPVIGGTDASPADTKPKDPDPPTNNTPSGPTIIRPQQ